MELSERKKEILKSVIDAYILTGEPVGSKFVAQNLKKPCSSATIRNEMSDLEELGLLEQPHTSAGRIPTGRGYRMYVDSLMEEYRLSFEETLILNALLSEAERDREKGIADMTRLLAKMTDYCVVTFSKENTGTIERFEGVYIHPRSFLLVMITSSGRAITKQMKNSFPIPAEGVEFLIEVLNDHLAKKELGGVTIERMAALENSLGEYRGLISVILQVIYDVMAEIGKTAVKTAGVSNLFRYPEFHDPDHARVLLSQLEDEDGLIARFAQDPAPSLQVHIGTGEKGLDGASFVSCPFRIGKRRGGVVCILGPRRMNYAKAMARLEYVAKQISAVHGFEPTLPMIETRNDNE